MSYLSKETRELISRSIGISYKDLLRMDDDEITAWVEEKTGRKIKWKKEAMVDGLPIVTPDEINNRIDKLGKKSKDIER